MGLRHGGRTRGGAELTTGEPDLGRPSRFCSATPWQAERARILMMTLWSYAKGHVLYLNKVDNTLRTHH